VEYLAWATDAQDLPPLVTSSTLGTPPGDEGVLEEPETSVLYGDHPVNGDLMSGGRITLGWWWDLRRTGGIQASYFGLADQEARYDTTGVAIVSRPFLNVDTSQPDRELVAYPGQFDGDVDVFAVTRFQGANVLLRNYVMGGPALRVDLLAGYRFCQLYDRLAIQQQTVWLDELDGNIEGSTIARSDRFRSMNNFHGGEVGLVARCGRGRWSIELLGKVALGGTWNSINIDGRTTGTLLQPPEDPEDDPVSVPIDEAGGLLALPTNIGLYRSSQFSVLSEFGVSLQYHLSPYTRVSVGYDLLGWTDVGRAADQIDLGINPSQVAPPPGTLVGEPRPKFARRASDFWAQGLNVRLECQY
jgi:hypothetical protein